MQRETILIVDDEMDIVSFIKDALEDEGYEVLTAYNGEEAIQEAQKKPDMVLLDVMMEQLNGFEVCQRIRSLIQGPIIFLSACQEESDRIKGLVVGGDDYLVKPFSLSELKARVHAHMRREKRKSEHRMNEALQFGEISIDYKARMIRLQGVYVELTNKQFDIIWLLAQHKGQVFSRQHIYESVWGLEADGDDSTVTEHIKKIRAKFQAVDPHQSYIQTVWGVGYKWL
ncbi:response regulator transcription factor [Microbacteriaceae bacterium 4G12]